MRLPGMLLAVFAVTLGVTASAHALPRARLAEPSRTESPNTLPADPGVTPQELVAAALRLPAAQLAMQHLADAGFTRAPEGDVGRISDGHVCVTLAFIDPSAPARAPLVIVRSEPTSVPPQTAVASAVFDVDPATGAVQLAPGIPDGAECVVTTTDMTSTRPDNYIVTTGAVQHAFMKWLQCAVLGCTAGASMCFVAGTLVGPLAPPAIAGCTIASCAVASFVCMW